VEELEMEINKRYFLKRCIFCPLGMGKLWSKLFSSTKV